MTAEEILEQTFNLYEYRMVGGVYNQTEEVVLEAMREYARLKCKELLEIVAEKVRIVEDGDIDNPYEEYFLDLGGSLRVNKDSILNAVDLEDFCS